MTVFELTFAIIALLITPGPTNTLLFVAGAERGWYAALRLIPSELLGYLVTVVPLTLIGAVYLNDAPRARALVAVMAGLWVAWLAFRLWRPQITAEGVRTVTALLVFVTTMLNPKALIFGLVLLPSVSQAALSLPLFSGLVVLIAAVWAGMGAWLGRTTPARPSLLPMVRRIASVWLAVVSVTLLAKGFGT